MRKITILIGIVFISLMAFASECKEHNPVKKRAITEWRFKRVKSNEMDLEEEDVKTKGDKYIPPKFMFKNLPIYIKLKDSENLLEV